VGSTYFLQVVLCEPAGSPFDFLEHMDQFWGVWGVSRNVGKARVENAREHTDDGWEPWRKDTCPDIQNIKVRRVDQVARATLGKMLGLIEHAIRKFLEPQSF
jgi:hypothetical protein